MLGYTGMYTENGQIFKETMLHSNTSLIERSFGYTGIATKHNQEPGGQKHFSKKSKRISRSPSFLLILCSLDRVSFYFRQNPNIVTLKADVKE